MASVLAFLKALPEMVKILGELNQSIKTMANLKTERDASELKRKVAQLTVKLKNARSKNEISAIISDLNNL